MTGHGQRPAAERFENGKKAAPGLGQGIDAEPFIVIDHSRLHELRQTTGEHARGAVELFVPCYSPDQNPIEKAFQKLKTLLRKAKARTYEDLWKAVGHVCSLFTPQE
ncbi:transposase [Hoeflea sp. CAU 1731]